MRFAVVWGDEIELAREVMMAIIEAQLVLHGSPFPPLNQNGSATAAPSIARCTGFCDPSGAARDEAQFQR